MRSFLRYAQYRGEVAPELVAAVPAVATWTTTPPLPKGDIAPSTRSARSTAAMLEPRSVYAIVPCCCSWRVSGCALTRSSRCSSTTATGTPVACGCAARVDASASCRCPPMSARPSLLICEHGRPTTADRHLFLRSMAPIRGLLEGSGRHRLDRALRASAGQGRRTAHGLASVPACLGRPHA